MNFYDKVRCMHDFNDSSLYVPPNEAFFDTFVSFALRYFIQKSLLQTKTILNNSTNCFTWSTVTVVSMKRMARQVAGLWYVLVGGAILAVIVRHTAMSGGTVGVWRTFVPQGTLHGNISLHWSQKQGKYSIPDGLQSQDCRIYSKTMLITCV